MFGKGGKGSIDVAFFMLISLFFVISLYTFVFGIVESLNLVDGDLRTVILVLPLVAGPGLAWLSWKHISNTDAEQDPAE